MTSANSYIQNVTFIDIFFVIMFSYLLSPLWGRFVDNLTFNALKLNKDSTYHTFIIALVATVILIVLIFSFDSVTAGLIEQDITGFIPPSNTTPTTRSIRQNLTIDNNGNIKIDDTYIDNNISDCPTCARLF